MTAPRNEPPLAASAADETAASSCPNNNNNVRVVVRIRPLSDREREQGNQEAVETLPGSGGGNNRMNDAAEEESSSASEVVQVHDSSGGAGTTNNKRWFELDAVLDGKSTQRAVYLQSGAQRAVTQDLFKGFNCTILAYGQTGAGKTFTMGTTVTSNAIDDDDSDESVGIIPRATVDLFDQIQQRCDGNARVTLSYLEIYNEEIRDLLQAEPTTAAEQRNNNNSQQQSQLRIRETLNGEVYVHGLSHQAVTSPAEIGKYMEQAASRRKVAATAMNAVSSRSHAICVLNIEGILEDDVKFQSKLTLVDLAGSERIKKTGASNAGSRRQEGININKGLLVLGQVVSALAEQRPKYKRKPPYRDSKLTRLLQDSLGGNSRTIMVACVSPALSNLPETINTLRYATSARNIKNSATRNVIQSISPEQAQQLQRQNQLLQEQVKELQATIQSMTHARQEAAATTTAATTVNADAVSVVSDDDLSVDDEDSWEVKRIRELEKEVRHLKSDLRNKESSAASSSNNNTNKNQPSELIIPQEVADSAIQVPELHKRIAQLEEELSNKHELEKENEQLQTELEEAKADAHSALLAANKMSKILDQLKAIKSDEIEKKRMENEHMKVEEAWVHFVYRLLENNRDQIRKLKEDFYLVARVVESPDVVAPGSSQSPPKLATIDSNNTTGSEEENSNWYSRLKMFPAQANAGRFSWSMHGGVGGGGGGSGNQNYGPNNGRSNFSMHGGRSSEQPRQDPGIKQQLLYEHIRFYNEKLMEVELEMGAESDSIAHIRDSLRRQREEMEKDIGATEFERESLNDRGKDKDLLEELTMLLVGPVKNLGDFS